MHRPSSLGIMIHHPTSVMSIFCRRGKMDSVTENVTGHIELFLRRTGKHNLGNVVSSVDFYHAKAQGQATWLGAFFSL